MLRIGRTACATNWAPRMLLSSHLLRQVEQVCDRIGCSCAAGWWRRAPWSELTSGLDGHWVIEVDLAEHDRDVAALLRGVRGVAGVERDGATLDRAIR